MPTYGLKRPNGSESLNVYNEIKIHPRPITELRKLETSSWVPPLQATHLKQTGQDSRMQETEKNCSLTIGTIYKESGRITAV